MCLAVPGRLVSITEGADAACRTGRVDFQGSRVEVNLACTPNAAVGDWLLVHAGFAIGRLDEKEARETFELLRHDEALAAVIPPATASPGGSP